MTKGATVAVVTLISLILLASTCFSQNVEPIAGIKLQRGQVAPTDGVLFGNESLMAIANALRELLLSVEKIRALEGQTDALERESVEKDKFIASLQEAGRNLQAAIEQLKFINSNHKLIEDAYKAATEIYKQALVDAREDNKTLRSELFWTKILGALPIIGLIVTAMGAL